MTFSLRQKILAEFIGTYFLVLTVVGSGIMGELMSNDLGIILLGNTIATGAILYVIISMFINISGAYFNPAVVLSDIIQKNIPINYGIIFIFTQIIAGIFGCLTANWYFEYPIIEWSLNERVGVFKFFSEIIATVGLLLTIFILKEVNKDLTVEFMGLVGIHQAQVALRVMVVGVVVLALVILILKCILN